MSSARVIGALAAVCLFGCAVVAHANDVLTIEEFTNRVARRIVFKKPDIRVNVEPPSTIILSNAEGEISRAYTDNTYEMYLANAGDEALIIENFAKFAIANTDVSEDVDVSRVLPVVRNWSWLSEITAGMEIKSGETWDGVVYTQQLFDELILALAEDSEQGLAYLKTGKVLAAFGTPAEAKRVAYANGRRLLTMASIEDENGLKRVRLDGTYETSLILFDEIWSDKRLEVAGDIVIAIPARGELLATGSDDAEGLVKLRSIANVIGREHPYRNTTHLFVRRDGTWMRFDE